LKYRRVNPFFSPSSKISEEILQQIVDSPNIELTSGEEEILETPKASEPSEVSEPPHQRERERERISLRKRNLEDQTEERPKKEPKMDDDSRKVNVGRRLFVGNLSYRTSWQNLKDHFRPVGNVLYADVLMDSYGSKGCGIVEFESVEEAERAVHELNDSMLDGRKIFIREDREEFQRSSGRGHDRGHDRGYDRGHDRGYDRPKGNQIFVGNIPFNTSWQDLKDLFRGVGNVLHANVYRDNQGRSKGCGVVLFESSEDAQEAIRKFNGKPFNGRQLLVQEDKKY
jgi:RNA recognition motif-containing protein